MTPQEIIEYFQKSSIEQIALDIKNGRSITQSQSGTESESSKDYVGRVAFEFFQNAVDRANLNIWMELQENEFIIANDGMPFSIYSGIKDDKQSDFYGLNSIHNGTKTAGESIGNKGVGFKSCWNVSNHVIIESIKDDEPWGFELFNPVSVDKFSESKEIKEAIVDAGGKVPSFYFPKYHESKIENFKENEVTKITIELKDENAHEEIKKELEEFQKAKFIFLNQLKNKSGKKFDIYIKIDGEENILQSENKDWHIISLKDKNNKLHQELKEIRENQSYKNIPVEPNIAIAFPPENIEIDSKFYTYLPTKADCGFNILIHADFALDNARVSIPDNDYNKKILEIAAKIFVKELFENNALHKRADFAKFLMPKNKDDKFAQFVWGELKKDNKLTEILKKVFTKDINFEKESYENIFNVIESWTTGRASGAGKEVYYNKIYADTIQYFCDKEIFIVYINEQNKTFLPPKKEKNAEYDSHLFYKSDEDDDKNRKLDFDLLKGIDTLKISNFESLSHERFQKNNIVRKFSTLEILRVLKAEKSIEIIKFVQQLLENTKEELSEDVKKQLLDLKLPTQKGFVSVKNCYINICTEISDLFSDDFAVVDTAQLEDINELDAFLTKIGVANNRLPFADKLPFKEDCDFSNLTNPNSIKEFISKSLTFLNVEMIKELANIKWFYDELKGKFYAPENVFLFKTHDNRKIDSIAQERKNNHLTELYLKFQITEIDDTTDCEKLIHQLIEMKKENIDTNHQDLYKKLTYQLSKVCGDKKEGIPILAIDIKSNTFSYIDDKSKIIFLETKYKQYKEQLKESYDYIAYLDTNMSHEFVQKIGITVFSPNYTIVYKDDKSNIVEPTIDNELKKTLQDDFLAPFFALAEEVLGSNFEKEDAIKRWENLTIKKAHNVIFTIKDNSQQIVVASTEQPDIDVLYIPIKDKYNNPTLTGEVAHDLAEPSKNSNLRKFAQVFAEGIFRSQKLKSDFELYITGHKDKNLQKEILINKGVEDNHIESMKSFIKESLLTDDEKKEVVDKLKELNVVIDDYSQIRDFEEYKELNGTFDEFIQTFEKKYKSIIENLINDYMTYTQSSLLKKIEENKKHLEVLCFMKHKYRSKYEEIYESIKNRKIQCFKNENNIYELFGVFDIDKYNDEYIEALLDFENYTDEVNSKPLSLKASEHKITANSNPRTGNAKRKKEERNQEERNEKIGLGQELKIAYEFAKKISNKEEFIKAIKDNIFKNDDELKDNTNLKEYLDNLDLKKYKDDNNSNFAKKVIQIAHHDLDGLGYDLIIPSFDKNNEIIGIKKVELKTTTRSDNIEIHFSHNEIQRILHYMDVDNWEIWLNIEENNITQIVRDAVVALPKELPFSFTDYILKLE